MTEAVNSSLRKEENLHGCGCSVTEETETLCKAQLFYIKGGKNPSLRGNRAQLCEIPLLTPAIKSLS